MDPVNPFSYGERKYMTDKYTNKAKFKCLLYCVLNIAFLLSNKDRWPFHDWFDNLSALCETHDNSTEEPDLNMQELGLAVGTGSLAHSVTSLI